ncbi:hypothetical protein NDU88_003005 [Pleurodeles waltl]|uniref:Uncharacterized protein n=1 Tax=Pleurodeles waltl TaxID=8319 RepID=A0AAV7SDA5_PLEWA|nr:hypothetical protein NDU88_003005 [Pleurodeles waltl]
MTLESKASNDGRSRTKDLTEKGASLACCPKRVVLGSPAPSPAWEPGARSRAEMVRAYAVLRACHHVAARIPHNCLPPRAARSSRPSLSPAGAAPRQ